MNKEDKDGRTPLYIAARKGQTEVVAALLATPGIDVNKEDKDGRTPLFIAAQQGHTEVVAALLATPGIDVNKEDKDGRTPLYIAAQKATPKLSQPCCTHARTHARTHAHMPRMTEDRKRCSVRACMVWLNRVRRCDTSLHGGG